MKEFIDNLDDCVGKTISKIDQVKYIDNYDLIIQFDDDTWTAFVPKIDKYMDDASIYISHCPKRDFDKCLLDTGILSEEEYNNDLNRRKRWSDSQKEKVEQEEYKRLKAKFEQKLREEFGDRV